MKKHLTPAVLLLWSFLPGNTFATPPTVTIQFQVPAMKCSGCSWSVTESLKKLEGVSAVHVDWKSKTALLEAASTALPGNDTISRAVKTVGYTATGFRHLPHSFAEAKRKLGETG